MNRLKLNTKDESLREILGNGKKYIVPKFQRDYSWESEQLETLWEDMQDMIASADNYHYMGYVVLQETKVNEYKIIDGQQRLTTFSLFVLACIKRLKDMGDTKIHAILFRSFIGVEEFDGVSINKKLTLNKNNEYYYNEATQYNELPRRGVKKTVSLMRDALDFFYTKLNNKASQAIVKLIEDVANRFIFTNIYIGDELNAYKVFETLNARGVQLSSADLLKNYIFSIIDTNHNIPDTVLSQLEDKWEKIGTNIGDKYYTDYILAEWNSRHTLIRKAKLFSAIQKEIKGISAAKNYLDSISHNSFLYQGLTQPDSDFFKDHPDYISIKKKLSFLKLFNIRQPISLLLIAYQKQAENFAKILHWITVFSLRYNVICRFHPGEQETLYNQICLKITNGCVLQELKVDIFKLYPQDKKFREFFADKTMLTSQSDRKAKYLLARLEECRSPNTPIDESSLTIEHILPCNPNATWLSDFGNDYQLFTQRIGNLALVSKSLNKKLAQKSFAEKQKILLQETDFRIHQNLKDYSEWTSQEVTSRQNKLADIALKTWRID